jgi:hypothetical protein
VESIAIGNFEYTQDDQGNWIGKAQESKALKKDGTLKAQYKELPRYKMNISIEDLMRKQMNKQLKGIIQDLNEILK